MPRRASAEETAAERGVEQALAPTQRVHAELGADERVALGVGQSPVRERAADRAVHPDLAQLVELIDDEVRLSASEDGLARDLDEFRPFVEFASLDIHDAGKPFGITTRISDELPDPLGGSGDQRLLMDL